MKRLPLSVFVFSICVALAISGCSNDPDDQSGDSTQSDASPSDHSETPDTGMETAPSEDTSLDPDQDVGDTDRLEDGTDQSDAKGTTTFRITSPRSDEPVRYRLKVTVEPEKVRDGSRFEAEEENDSIEQDGEEWLITGETGTAPSADETHGDSFRWPTVSDPEYGISGWSTAAPASDYTITINGEEIDPASLPELETDPPEQTDCVGGGSCYERTLTSADADATVDASADRGELQSALDTASSGDVVFVDPGAEIDLGFFPDSSSLEIPAGVTLASDRGVDGSDGARLFGQKKPGSDWEGSDTIVLNDDVRITGLRIEGPTPDREMNWLGDDHDYTDGIEADGTSGVEIDNNEIYGWPAAAIHGGDPVHVHHNYIHDNDQSGLGYGVSSSQWDSIIEYNQFRRNRHAVAGSGSAGDGYILRYNTFGSEGIGGAGHKIDMHEDGDSGLAGTRMEIYNNTVKFPDAQAVYLRGTPRESTEIYQNWFYNSTEPCISANRSGGYCAIEVRADDFTNVDYHDNHYGSSEPSCNIGAPRDGC